MVSDERRVDGSLGKGRETKDGMELDKELKIDSLEYFIRLSREICIGTLSLKHGSMTTNVCLR